ncbi:MAG: MarR family transcriptional regulator [Candidatus Nitrosocosmicus sp.]
MGGNKKKPTQSNTSKTQDNKNAKKEDTKKTTSPKTQKQKLSVLIEENQGMKSIGSMRAITSHGLARALGVKISVANSFIKSLENKNIVKNVGGYSGHRIYSKINK